MRFSVLARLSFFSDRQFRALKSPEMRVFVAKHEQRRKLEKNKRFGGSEENQGLARRGERRQGGGADSRSRDLGVEISCHDVKLEVQRVFDGSENGVRACKFGEVKPTYCGYQTRNFGMPPLFAGPYKLSSIRY